MLPKPSRTPRKAPKNIRRTSKPIARRARVRKQSRRRSSVLRDDAWWSGRVREEAGGLCERCGGVGTAGHHVFGKKAFPKLRYVLANGVWVCAIDHTDGPEAAHRKPVQFKAWFAQHRPESWRELQERLGLVPIVHGAEPTLSPAPQRGRT